MKKDRKGRFVNQKLYEELDESFNISDMRYWGIFGEIANERHPERHIRIDPKRFQKMTYTTLDEEQLKVVNRRRSHYFHPAKIDRYDYNCNWFIQEINQIKSDWYNMWNNYADGEKGYCIEYDLKGYKNINLLFPVVYQDNRETNIVINMVAAFIGQMIVGMSYGQIKADRSQFMRMFLTKDTKWAYQKEWRLLGDAYDKLPAPTIHAIFLGKNMDDQNKKQMIDYCQAHNIIVHIGK